MAGPSSSMPTSMARDPVPEPVSDPSSTSPSMEPNRNDFFAGFVRGSSRRQPFSPPPVDTHVNNMYTALPHATAVDNEEETSRQDVLVSKKAKGPSKSFSFGRRSMNTPIAQFKHQVRQAQANIKSVLLPTRPDRGEPSISSSSQARSPRPTVTRRRSSMLLLTRPWTSHVNNHNAVTPSRDLDSHRTAEESEATDQAIERFPVGGKPPLVPRDPSCGAAARQAARDFGKTNAPATALVRHDSTVDHHWVQHDRDRESGISLSMDSLRLSDYWPGSSGAPPEHSPRFDPSVHLPAELFSNVLSFLSLKDLLRAERVSRRWRVIAADPHLLRKNFIRLYAPSPSVQVPVGGAGIGRTHILNQDWKAMVRAREELERRWRVGPEEGNATVIYLNGHTDSVYCVQFDEDKVVTGSRDRTIRIWDIKTGHLRKVIGMPEALESDRRERPTMATQPSLTPARLQVINDRPAWPLVPSVYHVPRYWHSASILCLQYDDEICISGSSDCSLIIWDLKTWQPIRQLRRHAAGVLDIAFDAVKIVSCSKDGTICVWDRADGTLLAQLTGHRGPVNAVQMRGECVVSASGEGCAKLWNVRLTNAGTGNPIFSARCVRDFWSQDRGLACVEFSSDGRFILAGGNDQVIYVFNATTGTLVDTLRGHTQLVRSLYLDEVNARVVSGSYDVGLRVWDYSESGVRMSQHTSNRPRRDTGTQQNGNGAEAEENEGRELWCLDRWASSWILAAKSDYRRVVSTSQDGRGMVLDFGRGIAGVDLLEA